MSFVRFFRSFIVLCVFIVTSAFDDVTDNCIKTCSFQNETQGFDWCDGECRRSHCEEGCRLWETAVAFGCYSTCNSIEGHSREQSVYCLIGCNSAVSLYVTAIKGQIGTLPVPVPVPGSVTNTSISLKWTWNNDSINWLLMSELTNLSLQWRYSKPEASPFWRSVHSSLLENHATVDGLHPFAGYNFRLVASLAFDIEPLMSDETPNITTLPSGAPSVAPANLRVESADSERVSIAWDPPIFPNGPIISYTLTIREDRFERDDPSFRDFVALNSPRRHTFVHLKANTSYVISVAARNTAQPNETGPSALITVTTLPTENVPSPKPSVLIVVDDKDIERHDTRLVFYDPQPMYSMVNASIACVGVDVRRETVFVADDRNSIHELIGLYPQSEARSVVQIRADGFAVKKLSVDWLFGRLYLLLVNESSWQIARAMFDGSGLVELIAGRFPLPGHVEVDPFNGFLIWSVNSQTGGLFIVDLADLKDGLPAENEKEVKQLINGQVAAFKGDPVNGRVLAMLKRENGNKTVISVPFDGSLPTVVRHSMSQADEATDLIFTEESFYWVNKGDSIFEEIDDNGNIHVNKFEARPGSKHNSLVLSDVKAQPVPLPLGAVQNLQVLLDSESGRLKWDPPLTVRQQGRGAWRGWTYQIEIKNLETGMISSKQHVQGLELELTELQSNMSYAIKVEPEVNLRTESKVFVGRTLAENQLGPVYWAASDGQIYSSTLTGRKAKSMFDVRAMGLKKRESILSMAWMSDMLFAVTNASRMLKIDVASRNATLMKNIEAISVAVDWLGRKIYWGSSKRQTIGRCDADGSHQEWLPIVGIAKSLAVHSVKGKIAWSTGHAVEGAMLNGDHLQTFWSPGLFSGSLVTGLTVDLQHDTLYWIVKQIDGSAFLYQASIDFPHSSKQVSPINPSVQGPLHYSASRLTWLQDRTTAAISNLDGLHPYTIRTPKGSSIQSFVPCNIPEELPNVIPVAVEQSSITLQEQEDRSLIVYWSPVTVDHGNVSYDIHVHSSAHEITSVIEGSFFAIPKEWSIEPYEEINVTVRSFTVWSSASATVARLRSPPSTPEAPARPRAFVTLKGNSSSREATIELRWSVPLKTNGQLTSYRVLCSSTDGTLLENVTVIANQTELILRHLMPFTNYFITVEASTVVGYGPQSKIVNISTSVESPVPCLLAVTSNDVWKVDLDDHSLSKKLTPGLLSFPHGSIAYLNKKGQIFWIDNRNLFTFELGKAQPRKLYELNGTSNALVVDWISHQLYWSQKDVAGSSIFRLDNATFSPYENNVAQLIIHDPGMIALVNIDPLTSQIFWLTESVDGRAILMKSSANGERQEPFFTTNEQCSCSEQSLPIDAVTSLDYSAKETRLYWTAGSNANHPIWSADIDGCNCRLEFVPSDLGMTGGFSSLSIDANFFTWSDVKSGNVYHLDRQISNNSKAIAIKEIGSRNRLLENEILINTRKVALLSASTQPLPKSECLKPMASNYVVKLINKTSESLTLLMPEPVRPVECRSISMAPASYVLFYGRDTDEEEACSRNLNSCLYHKSSKRVVTLEKLMPYTRYVVHVVLTNYYQPLDLFSLNGNASFFKTKAGAPSRPENVTVIVTSPRSVRVQWNPPRKLNGNNSTSYTVHWALNGHSEPEFAVYTPPIEVEQLKDNESRPLFLDVHSLKPRSNYTFKVRAHSVGHLWTDSESITQETYPDPPALVVSNKSRRSVTLSWVSPKQSNIIRHFLQMYHPYPGAWNVVEKNASVTKPDHYYELAVEGLRPFTTYAFRLQLLYQPSGLWFSWPDGERGLTVTTDAAEPDRPGAPRASVTPDNALELRWAPVVGNGHPVMGYVLEMTADDAPSSANHSVPEWSIVYNGTDLFHVAQNLSSGQLYRFRLRAYNKLGFSDSSDLSPPVRLRDSVRDEAANSVDLILGLCISTMSVFIVALVGILVCGCRKSPFQAKKAQAGSSHPSSTSEMTDLATLRELPRRSSFIQQSNAIYDVSDCDMEQELALLPHIRFEDLFITKFLGRGAFGEVFEGSTSNLPGSNQYHTKVAVKTLRKGATDHEKNEFLKEAILMSHFKHDHILRLLGVCLDADPNFILLELMEGGDLLSYLRNNRPHQRAPAVPLGLYDLVSMCVDVAKGCCYLEELHFVHRDLAARNCLVSSLDPNYRVVKIGDFGLARDIYRNDYYRKEGEGLLPVRWMAPESLVDGVFTSQTDVWSFGVLLWEILTLGQQPYPARTNLQVLQFVRTGGRLDRPRNCPESLFNWMKKCWAQEPTGRPTFAQCLAELSDLQTNLRHATCTAVHNESYVSNPTLPRDCVASGTWRSEATSEVTGTTYQETETLNECPAIYSNTKEELMNVINQQREVEIAYSTDTEDMSPSDGPMTNEDRYLELLSDQSPAGDSDPGFNYSSFTKNGDNSSDITNESCLSRSATP